MTWAADPSGTGYREGRSRERKDHKEGLLKERTHRPSIPSLSPMMVSASDITLSRAMWNGRNVLTVDIGWGGVMGKEGEAVGCVLCPPMVYWSGEETPCDLFRTFLTPPLLLPLREGGEVVRNGEREISRGPGPRRGELPPPGTAGVPPAPILRGLRVAAGSSTGAVGPRAGPCRGNESSWRGVTSGIVTILVMLN